MSILAAFMVPHPPMIIPEIGRGSEEQIRETIKAYEQVAEEVAALQPETIVITSPHTVMYTDYFHISPGKTARGSFGRFGASQVKFEEEYDCALVERICELAEQGNFPAGTLGERDAALDHGVMVPLWFIRKKYDGGRIVRIGLSGLPLYDHYRMGQMIQEAAEDLGRRVVIIASGDLSHKLKASGPYGYVPEGPVYDERIMNVCGRAAFGELFSFEESFCEKAAECGHRSFVIMAGTFDGQQVRAHTLSHQDITGVGYGICTFYPEGEDESRHFLVAALEKEEQEYGERVKKSDVYVRLAYAAVDAWVRERRRIPVPVDLPAEMKEKRAGTFVSIHKNERLRGCIGTISATEKNIAEEIIQNAISAASGDPRFSPITPSELTSLTITVDVLGEAEAVCSTRDLDVKRYGVIVSHGRRRGLLLPDLEGVDTVQDQVRIARQKGGIREDEDYRLERFEVVRHY